ncbi:tRNA glutamyl-Q(34) synthetase GluQRS [Dokdonella sp.]|uniref:tRNA glutamyl-Q(34) synthetase GluQRS n=1 Tax=Dokdonella sp. TaxID=2291710 RepID=UPI001B177CC1|nr:tRNA glutamyl-Q(34) synthetase GluQRS [Dokdonella sp.]MBO9662451.1 tRNA glutamyl-Q(34) synthetase GluQRS [Dokdonella sp.]
MTFHRGRFAPSPSGRLHFGSLVAALGSWLFARADNGEWLVRIEDFDRERVVPGAADDILATLHAFGFDSDRPVIHQSERDEVYRAALRRLEDAGQVYPCWCSRADLAAFGGIHPQNCIARPDPARAPAWRLRVPDESIAFLDAVQGEQRQDLRREVGDFVVWRVEKTVAYQLAVVVDDAAQGITAVVRGADLLDSTPRQILLQRLLDLPRLQYAHLPLALGADGRKLSKHELALPVDGDDPLPALRAALRFLGQPLPPARNVRDLLSAALEEFDAGRIPCAPSAPAPFAALRKDVC